MPKRKKPPAAPKPRRARGTGSGPYPDPKGGYFAKVPIGRYPNGRTKYTEVRDATHAGCVAKMLAARPPDPDTLTVAQWAERWLSGLSVAASTLRGYRKQVEARIVPTLGHVGLRALKLSQVREAQQVWARDGTATANRTLDVAAALMGAARLDELVARNVFADAPKLKHAPKPLDPFSVPDLRRLVANRHTSAAALLAFVAGTGCRIGEAAALDVTDYDPATGRVSITKTWTIDHGSRAPKSKHSRRTLTVPPAARPAVERATAGRTSGILFRSKSGERFTNSQTYLALGRVCVKLGLRKRGPHQIRHGVLTALVNSGAPLGDVAKFAGHSVAQLIKTYLHPAETDPAEKWQELLSRT